MKTPLQELIEQLKQEIENQVQFRTEFEDGVVQGLEEALDLAEDMLKKEKEVMCEFASSCFDEINDHRYRNVIEVIDEHYNETFNTKEI